MAAYAALVSLITTMDQIHKHPRLSISFDTNRMESIIEKVGLLLDFVENDTHGVISTQVEVLESQIASAANAAEDLIESHAVGQIQAMKDAKRKFIKPMNSMRLLCCLKKAVTAESDLVDDQIHGGSISVVDLQTVIEDMDSVKKKVMAFKEESGSRDDMQPTYSMPTATTTASSSATLVTTDKNTMVGFDQQLIQLLYTLTGQQSNRQIIPIYNVKQLLLQLLAEKHSQIDNGIDEQLLGEKLYKRLWGRRYLIVIDDIWSIEAWDKVSRFFPDNDNGCRIVVTTRISNMATHFGSLLFELSFLDENQSWKLFCKKVFRHALCPSKLEDIGKEIVKKCKGLPLSISVIGGLLRRSHMTQEYWKYIAKDLISILNFGNDENCLSILSLSYNYLPAHLKPCFLYMGIFPEDHEIRVSQLIKLWVAEGFIKSNESQSLEEIARVYLYDLIDKNLILKHNLGSDGRIKICKIHDLLRELCLKVAQKDEFFCVMEDIQRGIERGRRIVCNEELLQAEYESRVIDTLQLASVTRSLVTSVDSRLSNSRLLRVMTINNEFEDNYLHGHIVDQVNMRYLAYNKFITSSDIINLPSSIGVLWNLQTIIMRRNKIKAPSEIWEMRQLRHVDIWGLHLPEPPKSGDQKEDEIVLQNLQTLKRVENFVWSEEACERVVNVRKLQIVYDRHSKRSNDYSLYNIGKYLHKLESLTCFSYGLDNVLQKLTFPSSLKKLHLQGYKADWKDLRVIGLLPNLEVLKLKYLSAGERVWNPVEGGFIRLKFLFIRSIDLVNWNADSSHFPVLEKLFLIGMFELEEIPLDIGEIPTLGLIQLVWCSESAAISAMKIAEEQENAGNDGLQEKMKQSEDITNFTRNNFQAVTFKA
ncbi:hypothetical protein MIMGU_mgv1a022028mg [Erythranthe guttata]|uniref:Uncharacterized protein n=1 Tax=Erythranthe guttata TaxID=4155 RepID=A0A022Q7D8_ERYGU|nr:hypothetical protein MIMGU_mgv1a022028mg [Erythranthe guttata]